jgi:hypothetical protein
MKEINRGGRYEAKKSYRYTKVVYHTARNFENEPPQGKPCGIFNLHVLF